MKKQITILALLKYLLAIVSGFIVIIVLSSIFARLQVMIYPRSSVSMYRSTDLTGLDEINFVIRAAYVCLSCIIGGIITKLIGRRLILNVIVGIAVTVLITWTALRMNLFHPVWFWITLIIFITPSLVLGYRIMKNK